MTSPFVETPEGFLKGRAVITTTGIFTYLDSEGKPVRELRLPEEVFKPAFLDSLKLKPITNNHPKEDVKSLNVSKYLVGVLGNNPSEPGDGTSDNYSLSIDMIIHDAKTVQEIRQGKRQLSVGYTADLEKADVGALWCGQPYDYIQRNLIANHTAIVDRGRAGEMASIRLDCADAHIQIEENDQSLTGVKQEDGMADDMFKSVKLDGVEYKAEAKVAEALHVSLVHADALQSELDTLKQSRSQLEAEKDVQKERADALDIELVSLKKSHVDSSVIADRVKARVALEASANKFGVVLTDGMDDLAVMTAVVKVKAPKASLEGKDALYVKVRYDSILEDAVISAEEMADAASRTPAGVVKTDSSSEPLLSGVERYRKNLVSQSSKKEA